MTITTNARVAGFTFWIYFAAGIGSMLLAGNAPATGVLTLVTSFCALLLGVTLYAITRDEDPDLAMLALTCRVGEGLVGASMPTTLALLWLATTTGPGAPDPAAAHALGEFLLKLGDWQTLISATLFAVGSTLF